MSSVKVALPRVPIILELTECIGNKHNETSVTYLGLSIPQVNQRFCNVKHVTQVAEMYLLLVSN